MKKIKKVEKHLTIVFYLGSWKRQIQAHISPISFKVLHVLSVDVLCFGMFQKCDTVFGAKEG